ncbi:MAG: hypothetical protein ACREGH_04320 [Minisyncoccia bacterium]
MGEKTFDLKITNGAATRLEALMVHFGMDEKKTVSVALELLDLIKNAESVEFKEGGISKGVTLPPVASKQ